MKKTLKTFNTLVKSNIGEPHPHGSAKKGNKIYYTTRTSPAKLVEVTIDSNRISTRSINLQGNNGESISIYGDYAFVPTDKYLNIIDLSSLKLVNSVLVAEYLMDLSWSYRETYWAENTITTPDGSLFVGWTLRYVPKDVLIKFKINDDGSVEYVDKILLDGKGSCHAMGYYNGFIYTAQGYHPKYEQQPDRVRKITKDLEIIKTVRTYDLVGLQASTDDLSICNGKIYVVPEMDHSVIVFDSDLNIVKTIELPSPDPDPNAPYFGGMGNDVLNDRYVIFGPTEKTTTLYVIDSTDDSLELVECGFSWGEEVTVIDNKIAMVNWDGDFVLGYLEEEITKTLKIESSPKSRVYVDYVYVGLT